MIARLLATPKWADFKKIRIIYQNAACKSEMTGVYHVVDHIIPLQHPLVCGLHNEFNLQVVTEKENAAKSNKFFIDQMELAL